MIRPRPSANKRLVVTWLAASSILSLSAIAACGNATSSGFTHEDSGGSGDGGEDVIVDRGMIHLDVSTGGDDASMDADANACPAAATLVYVTGVGSQLWSFYPPTLKFTLIGTLNCLASPTHMTVDRQASAWVVSNGLIYKASTKDASCTEVKTWKAHPFEFDDFALTFIGITNTIDDNLYLMSSSNLGLFDVASGTVTNIAASPAPIGDMTSDGDQTLFYLYDKAPPTLFNLDPKNGAVLSKNNLKAPGGGSQALAFWGGSFYAFENNEIFEYDPKMKTTKSLGMAPLMVTGAGQSTCVPKVPPPVK